MLHIHIYIYPFTQSHGLFPPACTHHPQVLHLQKEVASQAPAGAVTKRQLGTSKIGPSQAPPGDGVGVESRVDLEWKNVAPAFMDRDHPFTQSHGLFPPACTHHPQVLHLQKEVASQAPAGAVTKRQLGTSKIGPSQAPPDFSTHFFQTSSHLSP